MSFKEKLLQNKYGAILVLVALIIFVWWGSSEARAGEMSIDLGVSQVGSNLSTGAHLQLNNRISKNIELGFGYISPQDFNTCGRPDCEWNVRSQLYAGAEFIVHDPWKGKMTLGFGPYFFQNEDRIGTSRFRAGIHFAYRFNDRLGLTARHFSTAGSSPEITACNAQGDCFTNDWNTGQDSWLRGHWYF